MSVLHLMWQFFLFKAEVEAASTESTAVVNTDNGKIPVTDIDSVAANIKSFNFLYIV